MKEDSPIRFTTRGEWDEKNQALESSSYRAAHAVEHNMEEPVELRFDEKTTTASPNGTTEQKKAAILEACRHRDLGVLRALAESPGGFLTDGIRQQACKCPF